METSKRPRIPQVKLVRIVADYIWHGGIRRAAIFLAILQVVSQNGDRLIVLLIERSENGRTNWKDQTDECVGDFKRESAF